MISLIDLFAYTGHRFAASSPFCSWLFVDALYDGRLYRCDVKFSGSQHLPECAPSDARRRISEEEEEEDDVGWEEREASRTHSVKFHDVAEAENKEVSDGSSCCFPLPAVSARALVTRFARSASLCVRRAGTHFILLSDADINQPFL